MAVAQFALTGGDLAPAPIYVIALVVSVVGSPGVIVECDDAAASHVKAIYNDKSARRNNVRMHIKRKEFSGMQSQFSDFMTTHEHFVLLPRHGFQRGSVDDPLDGFNSALHFLCG